MGDGEDILAHEDPWIKVVYQQINTPNVSSDRNALNDLYKIEVLKKLHLGGKDAVKFS